MNSAHPIFRPTPVRTRPRKRPLTFGDFVAGGCRAWGEREAVGIIRLVLKVRWLEFGGSQRLVIS